MATAIAAGGEAGNAGRSAENAMRVKHAHAGVAMALATFAMAAASGVQAVLYLGSFGIDGRTDGFFAAFALYAIFGVFSQSIRVTSAPLLVGRDPTLTTREFAATLVLIAVPVAIATVPLAVPLATLLAPGLSAADRAVTQDALPILGVAMVLQLWAAGAATILAVRDRFRAVAVAYSGGAAAGLVAYLALSGPAGELSLGWSMMTMAVVTFSLMLGGLSGGETGAEPRRSITPRLVLTRSGVILGRTVIYLAFNALYLVTLAFVSGHQTGDATVLSYAYLYASYLVAGTAFALGLSRIADMRRAALAEWRSILRDTAPQGLRYSMVLIAPAMAALVTCVAPLIGRVLPDQFGPHEVATLRLFGGLLAVWAVVALLVNLLLPAMFALGRAGLANGLAVPLIALHVLATAIGGALFGAGGVVGAAFVAPLCFAVVLLRLGARGEAASLARVFVTDILRFAVPAAAAYGGSAALGAALLGGASGSLFGCVIGSVLYGAALVVAAPRQARVLGRGLRPLAAER